MTNEATMLPGPIPKDPNWSTTPRPDGMQGPYQIAEVTTVEGQLKHGKVQGFSVRCDESSRVGGEDSAPSPLGYFTVAMGF